MNRFATVIHRTTLVTVVCVLTGGLLPQGAAAQTVEYVRQVQASCTDTERVHTDLGIGSFVCGPCTQTYENGREVWQFDSEPVVGSVREGGPADGKLRPDDEIVAIDGHLITSAAGGRRWSNLQSGQVVNLRIRRARREQDIQIIVGATCVAEDAPSSRTIADRVQQIQRVVLQYRQAVQLRHLSQQVRFGFVVSCDDCEPEDVEGAAEGVWSFHEPPEIRSVTVGGPAAMAGLMPGDRLTEIDGLSLIGSEGALRFSNVEPNQTVRFTVQRGGDTHTIEIAPEARHVVFIERQPGREEIIQTIERLRDVRDIDEIRERLDQLLRRLRERRAIEPN